MNEKQTDKLAEMAFDLAKGLLLGSVTIPIVKPIQNSIFVAIIIFSISILLVKVGLNLLNTNE